jgi:hypothetical protein
MCTIIKMDEFSNTVLRAILEPKTDKITKVRRKLQNKDLHIPYLLEQKTTLHIRRPPFTIFNFQENNSNIHISQVFMSLIVCILNVLELNNHLS